MSNFTETTRVGFGARIKNAIKGIGIGIALIGISVSGIFWNEGNSVRTARALTEGAGVVVPLTDPAPQAANEGALVHVNGALALDGVLRDDALEIAGGSQTVRLERKVEQFAWVEDKRTRSDTNTGGSQDRTTEYTYRLDWTDSPASGAEFRISEGHMNPPMPIRSDVLYHEEGRIGGFAVTQGVGNLGAAKPVILTPDQAQTIGTALGLGRDLRLTAGVVQTSQTVEAPQLGDLRISYFASDIAAASVVGVQHEGTLIPYVAANGRNVFLIEEGLKPASAMFETAQDANRFQTWALHALLIVVMFLGFKALVSILDVVASFIPFLGWLTSSVTSLVSLALTFIVGGGSIAIAWMSVRPMLSVAIVGVVAVGAVISVVMARRKAQSAPPDPA